MKWTLFGISLIALFVANNALFMVPEKYDWFTAVAVTSAICVAGICAWFGGKRFAAAAFDKPTWKQVVMSPPAVVWIFVIVLFCLVGLSKFVAYRN